MRTETDKNVGKKIEELIDDFNKTPIGELPKTHFWIDRDNNLCCGQITTKIKVDIDEAIKKLEQEKDKEDMGWKALYKPLKIFKDNLEDEIEELKTKLKEKDDAVEKVFEDVDKFIRKYDWWMTGSKVDIAYKQLKKKQKQRMNEKWETR